MHNYASIPPCIGYVTEAIFPIPRFRNNTRCHCSRIWRNNLEGNSKIAAPHVFPYYIILTPTSTNAHAHIAWQDLLKKTHDVFYAKYREERLPEIGLSTQEGEDNVEDEGYVRRDMGSVLC